MLTRPSRSRGGNLDLTGISEWTGYLTPIHCEVPKPLVQESSVRRRRTQWTLWEFRYSVVYSLDWSDDVCGVPFRTLMYLSFSPGPLGSVGRSGWFRGLNTHLDRTWTVWLGRRSTHGYSLRSTVVLLTFLVGRLGMSLRVSTLVLYILYTILYCFMNNIW